jgi:hypothetical protein
MEPQHTAGQQGVMPYGVTVRGPAGLAFNLPALMPQHTSVAPPFPVFPSFGGVERTSLRPMNQARRPRAEASFQPRPRQSLLTHLWLFSSIKR